jgi:predicted lactoylglutathione lyase
MVGYVTLGSNDLERAVSFYDALLGELGAKQFMNDGRMVIWGRDMGVGMLAVCTPYDEGRASVGNGVMVALTAEAREGVDRLHAKALELGGSDEGAPGPRGDGGFYGGYFRDLDGNKLCAFCFG